VSASSGCQGDVIDTGWLLGASSFTIPSGALQDGHDYYWCVQARDFVTKTPTTPNDPNASYWSDVSKLSVRLPKLGLRDYWPIWSAGPLSVNEATGNLILSLPGPSYPTAAGALAASVTYNLLDTRASVFTTNGVGAWTLGFDAPARLVDHSGLTGDAKLDAVERVDSDGSSDWYGHIGGSNAYEPPPGDRSVLVKLNSNNGFLLTDVDGSLYRFAPPGSDGVANLSSAQVQAANGQATLTYAFTSGKISSIAATGKDVGGVDRTLGVLTFNWSCGDALLCITGPDGVIWKYVGDGIAGTSGRLDSVFDGYRTILKIGYDAAGRPNSLQNANDLDSTNRSPGYLGAHSVSIGYDTSSRVQTVSQSVRSDSNASTGTTSRWTFAYYSGACPNATLQTPAASHTFTRSPLAGCTEVTPPNQDGQSSPAKQRVFYDVLAQPLEMDDTLGRHVLSAYDARHDVQWTEDELGNPTDYSYDPYTFALLSATGPDPDGAGSLPRPVTSYRYDETKAGTATTAGAVLQGLQAAYYSNSDLSGFPSKTQTDANVDSAANWGGAGPPALGGQTSNFGVRWTGTLTVATAGSYVLATLADGGSRLTIDDKVFVDKWAGQTTVQPACAPSTPLTSGKHRIVLEYHELTGAPSVKLQIGKSCSTVTTIAQTSLTPDWLNRTSVISPPNAIGGQPRLAFSHYKAPETHEPDYELVSVGGSDLVTSMDYDNYGRPARRTMPKGNIGRLQADGTLAGTPDSTYSTSYSYYNAGSAVAPPWACNLQRRR